MAPDPKRDALPSTPESLDALSKITPEDQDRAVATWKKHAHPAFKNLLDAKPHPGT